MNPADGGDVVAGLGVAVTPFGRPVHQRVVVENPPRVILFDEVDDVDEAGRFDLDTGFLANLANRGLPVGFAKFLRATRDTPLARARRFSTADQQDLVVLPHDGANPDDRPVRMFTLDDRPLLQFENGIISRVAYGEIGALGSGDVVNAVVIRVR